MVHVDGSLAVLGDPIRMAILITGFNTGTRERVDVYDSIPKRSATYVWLSSRRAVEYLESMGAPYAPR